MKIDIAQGMKTAKSVITANSPVLLVGTAVAGVVATGVLAARAGYKARGMVDEATVTKGAPLTREEKFKLTWLCYAAPATTAVTTIASVVGVHAIHSKRTAALTGLYALATSRMDDYREKAEQMLGAKKSQDLNNDVAQKDVDRRNGNGFDDMQITMLDDGTDVFYDQWSGRWLTSSIPKLELAVQKANNILAKEGEISLNDFYDFLGLGPIDMGSTFGWNGQEIGARFGHITAPDGRAAHSFYFQHEPKANLGRG